ncbi:MAG: hypothetical protein HONBIEJF_00970 [Fimbriimonadaceae bacterium]|nr:hypothetical protein [Fimbriimonadaceae bacterium]
MRRIAARFAFFGFAVTPFVVAIGQTQEQKAEQAFKDIQVFKGMPASDIIPAMQFMAASMNYKCTDCHVPNDYAAPHKNKTEARKMVILQRDINKNHFDNRLEVTCMTCHHKKEHPDAIPMPANIRRRHQEMESPVFPEELVDAHVKESGKLTAAIVRTGTLTAPNETTHKIETVPLELIQAPGGKYRIVAGDRKIASDGKSAWYGEYPLMDEPMAIFGRIGRTWVGDADFKGLTALTVLGKEAIGTSETIVVQGYRQATTSAEELYFDTKSNRLVRLVNFRKSSLGTVVSAIDFSNYKPVGEASVPMKVVFTSAEGDQWVMEFKTAKVDPSVKESAFKLGG